MDFPWIFHDFPMIFVLERPQPIRFEWSPAGRPVDHLSTSRPGVGARTGDVSSPGGICPLESIGGFVTSWYPLIINDH
jgi:hypothetical protein